MFRKFKYRFKEPTISSLYLEWMSLGISLGILLFVITNYVISISHQADAYQIGDWLINYQGGFVRRGLMGQIIFEIASTAAQAIWLIVLIQIGFVLSTAYLILRLYLHTSKTITWWIFLFSPAFFLLFPLYNVGGGFRKEIVVFFALSALAWGLNSKVPKRFWVMISTLTYAIAAFSHESAALCLPFFIYLVFQAYQAQAISKNTFVILALAYGFIAFIALGAASYFQGSLQTSERICQSWLEKGFDNAICQGSIHWLSSSLTNSLTFISQEVQSRSYISTYTFLALLSLLPIVFIRWYKKSAHIALFCAGALGILPLFIAGIDWGRWIYLFITLLFICIFFDANRYSFTVPKLSMRWVGAYLLLWSVPMLLPGKPGILNTYSSFSPGLGVLDIAYRASPLHPKTPWTLAPQFQALFAYYQKIAFVPLFANSTEQYHLGLAAWKLGIKTNSSIANLLGPLPFLSFTSNANLAQENTQNRALLNTGTLDSHTLYIVDAPTAMQYYLHNSSENAIVTINNHFAIAPQYRSCAPCTAIAAIDRWAPLQEIPKTERSFSFSALAGGRQPYLTSGWQAFSESWGTWSDSTNAQIILPIPSGDINTLELELQAFVNGYVPKQILTAQIAGMAPQTFELTQFDHNFIKLALPKERNALLILDLATPNARSPAQLGLGDDQRLLGIGIKRARFL
jgi:hypothetical protein